MTRIVQCCYSLLFLAVLLPATICNAQTQPAYETQDSEPSHENKETTQAQILKTGTKLFNSRCRSCHGNNGELKALGTANILKGQSQIEITKKIKGYVNSTYGFKQKKLMKNMLKKLSNEQVEALAAYIDTLK